MESSPDTEITLGTAKLLGLFFGLVVICAVFFALGYTLGRKSDVGIASAGTTTLQPTAPNNPKPASATTPEAAPAMSFYKAVEQKDADSQLTPTSESAAPASAPAETTTAASAPPAPATAQAGNSSETIAAATSGYFVQVAAVSKEDDAQALVDALKKKNYPAFVAASSSTDKLYRVQVGPFNDVKDAEAMRSRLINDGYSPILKK
ncbi:MAG: SPOR domain-containing protein [Candidatus Sulfotelmatobacter sp.]